MSNNKVSNLGRITVFSVIALLGLFMANGAYHFGADKQIGGSEMNWGYALGGGIFVVFLIGAYYSCFMSKASVSFINETEGELMKVVWPEYKPLKASTELWHSTLVVIGIVIFLAVFTFGIDSVINWTIQETILSK